MPLTSFCPPSLGLMGTDSTLVQKIPPFPPSCPPFPPFFVPVLGTPKKADVAIPPTHGPPRRQGLGSLGWRSE